VDQITKRQRDLLNFLFRDVEAGRLEEEFDVFPVKKGVMIARTQATIYFDSEDGWVVETPDIDSVVHYENANLATFDALGDAGYLHVTKHESGPMLSRTCVLSHPAYEVIMGDLNRSVQSTPPEESKREEKGITLIIHGHEETNLHQLRDFLQNSLGLPKPIVMSYELIPGLSLPEKFEILATNVEFAIALLTPDDMGKARSENSNTPRVRQNVLVEIGWFWGRLGRDHILLLIKDKVDIPSDLQGIEYYGFTSTPTECSEKIRSFYRAHRVSITE
jgi:predicted nucleotide-binding protein